MEIGEENEEPKIVLDSDVGEVPEEPEDTLRESEDILEEPEEVPGEKPRPKDKRDIYLQSEQPGGACDFAAWALMHGKTEAEVEEEGVNHNTVRMMSQKLEKMGLRKRPKGNGSGGRALAPAKSGELQVFAKGSPPESIINALTIPTADGQLEGFESGMKFGASVVVMGVRIAQELSSIGIQQARPLVEMARDMRSGEAMAAKNAAGEAAMMAAGQVQQNLAPYLANLGKPAAAPSDNPMKDMMVRMMEPIMTRMMGSIMPGMGPSTAPGWTKTQE